MLKNWKDSVGASITNKVNEGIADYNKGLKDVNYAVKQLEDLLRKEVKVTFNKKKILSLKAGGN